MSTTSPNMGLTIPVVSQEPGPAYATEINSSLTTIDSHNHSAGSGVQITPNGLNISSDLPFGGNNITLARSVRFSPQGSPISQPADTSCAYVSGVDLYYNDGVGNQVRITSGGGVAGSPGSITGLVSPATVTYVAPTFVFQSDVNTAANLDARSVTLRNSTAGSKGVTLSAPGSLPADITLTMPTLPAVQSFVALDASGNLSAPVGVSAGITAANIANGTITTNQISSNTITRGNVNATSLYPQFKFQDFDSNGTFVVGSVTQLIVLGVGGGGGGGGGSNSSGGGGGSGSMPITMTLEVVAGESLTIIAGSAGNGGAGSANPTNAGNGITGSSSQILRSGTILFQVSGGLFGSGALNGSTGTGAGGAGGFVGTALLTSGGAGGNAGGGGVSGASSIGAVGGIGGTITGSNQSGCGGGGGAGLSGTGGNGANGTTSGPGGVGQNAQGPGGGGSGGAGSINATGGVGGNGGGGRIRISWVDWH